MEAVASKGNILFFPPRKSKPTEAPKVNMEELADEAYDWLIETEKPEFCEKKLVIENLNDLVINYKNHISLFRKEGKPAIMRVFWKQEKRVIYYIVKSYDQILENSPELTALLIRNSIYVYLKHSDELKCFQIFKT